jgi:hypothetical protein
LKAGSGGVAPRQRRAAGTTANTSTAAGAQVEEFQARCRGQARRVERGRDGAVVRAGRGELGDPARGGGRVVVSFRRAGLAGA